MNRKLEKASLGYHVGRDKKNSVRKRTRQRVGEKVIQSDGSCFIKEKATESRKIY